jgi:Ca2+-transporting ATPase
MKIPADARVISLKDFSVNEAMLTGESNPVVKNTEPIDKDVVVGDRKNTVFMGTTVDRGEATAVITATGRDSEIGTIAAMTKKAEDDLTPLQERLEKLGKTISLIVLVAAFIIVTVGVIQKISFIEIFITSVAVAVAAIPEGLPAALAVILAISSQKILARGGLVKKLIAAESLGSTSVICADKTGTLTEGVMKVEKIITKAPKELMLTALALSNEAILEKTGDSYQIQGDTTDKAKLEEFLNSGISLSRVKGEYPLLAMVPFDSVNKYILSFHRHAAGVRMFITGAPEVFIRSSVGLEDGRVRNFTRADSEAIQSDYESMAISGFRMIGAGYRDIHKNADELSKFTENQLKDYVGDLIYLGLAAIRDPIRQEVKEIMKQVRSAGLKVVMITGDHKLTARAIGKELGMASNEDSIMEGEELNHLSDDQLRNKVRDIDIFARVDPIHKLRVVKAWKELGESVAATGDGINDAPALKMADIGIAVASGTDVTKEAADLVLVNDSFATIVEAIRQGRAAFQNIKKVTILLLSNSFTELILILGSLLLGVPLPVTAIQILWTNLVEDGLPNFALAFEPPEKGIMDQKPIRRNAPLLDGRAKFLSYPMGIITDLILFLIYFELYELHESAHITLEYLRTFMFVALGTDSLIYIFSLRSLDRPFWKVNHLQNKYFTGAIIIGFTLMLGAVYMPFLSRALETDPLSLKHLSWIALLGVYKLFFVEGVKWFYNRKRSRPVRIT